MNDSSVLVIGTAIVDCVIKGFDERPISKTGYRADSLTLSPGGEAVNQAVTLARLGMPVRIMCGMARDGAGRLLSEELSAAGADTTHVVFRDAPPTPVAAIFVDRDGNRRSITGQNHWYDFNPEKYISSAISSGRGLGAVSLGSLFRSPFDDPQKVLALLQRARSAGLCTYADTKLPNHRQMSLADMSCALPYVDYITPNEDEASFYTGESDPSKAADVFLSFGVKNVIIKLGAKGCFFKNAAETISLPAFPVDAVDATGAGDNFAAGFIYSRACGLSHAQALRFAAACGALCAMQVGATGGVKSAKQVNDFLEKF